MNKNELLAKHQKKMKQIEEINLKKKYKEEERAAKHKCEKKKIEESKFYIRMMFVLVLEIVIYSQLIMWRTGDLSGLYALIGISATLATSLLGYYSKSKAENLIKIKDSYCDDHDESDSDNVDGSVG